MKPETYLHAPLTEWTEWAADPSEPIAGLGIRFSCGEVSKGGLGFLIDVIDGGKCVLSSGLLATEAMFLSLYLWRVDGRQPKFALTSPLDQCWQTALSMRLYNGQHGTEANAQLWVEDRALWLGLAEARHTVAKTRLDTGQRAGLARLADAMDRVY
jgi:hypothetical protein